jgi:baculoviral IAP repeat-containing protein 2/3
MADLLTVVSLLSICQDPLKCTEPTKKNSRNRLQTTTQCNFKQYSLLKLHDTCQKVLSTCRELIEKQGLHSHIAMNSAGFTSTNNGNVARCHSCGLEVSDWTSDMKPFTIHAQRSPSCPFVLSMSPSENGAKNNVIQAISPSNDEKESSKNAGTEISAINNQTNVLVEVGTLKQIRKRTFSHWPHRSSPSTAHMIDAGFFNCNVGDRVICIYCNIICQQWTPNSDDPCEIHKTLSPKCPYVISMLTRSQASTILVINEHSTNDQVSASANTDPFRCNSIVYTAACNTAYIEIPKRYASFANWPNENLPAVDDLVRAGFFFTGTNTIVTCFYCNGSLQNWGSNDNPTIEHARWFPHCAYAKQLCGAELYRKIQESKRAQQGFSRFVLTNKHPILLIFF